MNKLGTYQMVEASTYIPVIGSVSSFLITGLAVKTMWNDRNHETKTLSGREHAKLALYNIVNIASLGLFGTSFGVVKLVACFFNSLANCCCAKQPNIEKSAEATQTVSFLTPKKAARGKDAVQREDVVEMLSPTPKKGKPAQELDEVGRFARLFAYINTREETLEEIQKELNKTIEEAIEKRISDLKDQIRDIDDARDVISILNQKVVSRLLIYPCFESSRIASIILSKFPELEARFSERARANWKAVGFFSNPDSVQDAINEAIFREARAIVNEAESAIDVEFILDQYMLHSFGQREIKEITRAASVILGKFPQLLGYFSDQIQKLFQPRSSSSTHKSSSSSQEGTDGVSVPVEETISEDVLIEQNKRKLIQSIPIFEIGSLKKINP